MSSIAFKFARSRLGKWSIGWVFENLSLLLPVDRLFETPQLIAFHHPKPLYPVHILIVPKKVVNSLLDLPDTEDEFAPLFMNDLLICVRKLVTDFALEGTGYRLIANGGSYQDVPELHFHLVSGNPKD